jgi:2-C-methyl-D-erythritol 2,4-cyclodiphosphate synthase
MMRIGQGYDVHRFTEGDCLVLGGVFIPFHQTFLAHSDGDVLLHALCDALLGACGLGDIGRHFPDTDATYYKVDSRNLLQHVMTLLQQQGYRVANADMTIVAQAPKLAPYIEQMQQNIAHDLQVDASQINVKATTTEGLGFAGRQEGVAAYAVVLIDKREEG